MVQTSCQDRVQAHALPEQRQGEKGLFFQQRQGFFAAAKYKERKLFMDEIKVVPYIPDEDYDNPAMVVDFYEFTMANCLFLHGFKNTTLVFDMFFRKNPDNMGYSISAGQRKLTRFLLNYHFNEQDIRWLRTKGMSDEFCEYLRTYKWKGDMYALPEGTVCYPHVQMVRIECDLVGAILIETYLLQTMNFHSLITTKATRVTGLNTHTPRSVMEFGTRRAQGESAGNDGAYAAVLGGCIGTANCLAEMKYGSEVKAVGTVAHSFIEFFPTEFDAFKAFADTYPDSVSLLLDTYNIMESGLPNLIKLDDYLIIATSSEGTVRNGAGDTIKMELMNILQGIGPPQEHVSIWWYKLDSVEEVAYPDMWIKANPNLGKTVTYETYQKDVDRAETAPATRNDMLAKRFGLPMEGYTYYFTYEETLPHRRQRFWQMPCSLGADLSQGDDFCSFTFLFPLRDGSFGVKTRNYITSLTLHKLPAAMRVKYEDFMAEGSLIVMEGTVLDMMQVYDDLDEHIINRGYDVRCFGYDPYNAQEFIKRWTDENGPFGVEVVRQGSRTESVPLGELKKLAGERMLLFDEELLTFSMGNCITMEDTNGNRKLLKKRSDQKIDAVAAMMDAYVAYKHNPEAFE